MRSSERLGRYMRRIVVAGLLLILMAYGSGCAAKRIDWPVPQAPEAPELAFTDGTGGRICLTRDDMMGFIGYVILLQVELAQAQKTIMEINGE